MICRRRFAHCWTSVSTVVILSREDSLWKRFEILVPLQGRGVRKRKLVCHGDTQDIPIIGMRV